MNTNSIQNKLRKLFFILCLMLVKTSFGQSASTYCFTASSGSYNALTGFTNTSLGSTDDDDISSQITIPFTFDFAGTNYTKLVVSSNGWLSFANVQSTNYWGLDYISANGNYTNSSGNALNIKPALFPLWDDLKNSVTPRYVVTGTSPNRIFKVEWSKQLWVWNSSSDVISFQVWLYEGTNVIDYIYSRGINNINGAASATIGIYDSADTYLTLSGSGTLPTASSSTFTTNINSKPATGQIYRFTPISTAATASSSPSVCEGSAITNITHTTTGATGIGSATGLPAGVTASWASNTITISGTPTTAGVYSYSIPLTGGCGTVNATGTITVKGVAPITAVATNATCSNGSDGVITTTLATMPLEFKNGDNDYIDLGSTLLSNRSAFTVEGWIKFKAADIGSRISLFGQNDVVEFFLNSGVMQLYTAGGGTVSYTYPASLGNNAWHHIAATGDGANIKLYIDGNQVVSGGNTTSNYGNSSYNAKIGSGVVDASGGGFTGQIYKTGFYYTALSASTISGLASNPTVYLGTESGLLAGLNYNSTGALTKLPSGTATLVNTPDRVDSFYTYSWSGPSSYSATTRDISGLAVGTYVLTATGPGSSSCPFVKSYLVGSTNTAPTDPTFTVVHPQCAVATGTITVTSPANGTGISYTLTGTSPVVTAVTNTTGVFPGLAAGNYNVTTTNASGCTSAGVSTTINAFVLVDNIYNGGWSLGLPPATNGNNRLVFDSSFVSNADLSGCSCLANADVTIKAGHTLTLTNELTVSGGVNMAFQDGSSLVQKNDVANSGEIDYNRTTYARKTDYTYWSTPVTSPSQTLGALVDLAGTFYSYEASVSSEGWVEAYAGTVMIPGKGYIGSRGLEVPVGTPPSLTLNATFQGVPNNGPYSMAVFSGKSCLLGNPYPSAISADSFLTENAAVLDGTLYFWTHNTAIQDRNNIPGNNPDGTPIAGSGAYTFTSDDYATYNGTGGAAVSLGAVPNGYIAAGQGFFSTAIATSSVNYSNSMRVSGTILADQTGANQQFFKTRASKTDKVVEKNRIWLNLMNTQGAFKQALVGYITDATNDYESRFDGESYDGNEYVDFYSVNQDKILTIQGRALPFDENDVVPLGYRSTITGDFTISIDQVDGVFTNQNVYIEDKLTNTTFDLKSGNYTFTTAAGTFNDRFVLRYTNTTLATNDFNTSENTVLVSVKNKQITVNAFAETIKKVTVYDLLGRQVYAKDNVNNSSLILTSLNISHQTLVVKTVLENGKTHTDKIIY